MRRQQFIQTRKRHAMRLERRRGAPWASLLLSFLTVLFLGLTAYASLLLYHTARSAARNLPPLTVPVPMPQWETLIGRSPANEPTPVPLAAPAEVPVYEPTVSAMLPLPNPEIEERINMVLLGVDRRPQEPGPPRTDTIIVVSIAPESKEVSMLSIPRDLWVPIPGYNINAKINQAYAIGEVRRYPGGGPALVKRTISELIGYPIHYYALVDFNGFRKLIDLIGGIEVCVPYTIHDEQFPTDDYGVEVLHIEAGCQQMDGDLALKYARTRHGDSDYARAQRQQQVLLAARNKVLQAKMLPTLILRAPQILRSLSGSVETDIPLDKLVSLARLAAEIDEDQIRREVIDNRYGTETYAANGAWILVPDREKLRPLFDSMFAPRTRVTEVALPPATSQHAPEPAEPPVPQPTLTPGFQNENALIVVLNGSGQPGLAARVAAWLEDQGFQVVQFGDLQGTPYPHSVLVIHTDRPLTRQALVERFRIRPENIRYSNNLITNVDMELFIGADFRFPESQP